MSYKVCDRTQGKKLYAGATIYAVATCCPCRPCYRIHDMGHSERVYDRNGIESSVWVQNMVCCTNFNNGCPQPNPEPTHIPMKTVKRCKRCGERLPKTFPKMCQP